MKTILFVVAATATVVFALAASPGLAAQAACVPGTKTIGGAPARVFCGPAKATVKAAGKTHTFANGECLKGSGLTVNIGTLSFAAKSKLSYFGLSLPTAKAGTYLGKKVTLSFNAGGQRQSLSTSAAKVVVKSGLRGGSFSGKDFSGRAVTGTFSC